MLKPVQRLDMGLSKLLEMETNMQKQAYSNMQIIITIYMQTYGFFFLKCHAPAEKLQLIFQRHANGFECI